MTDFRIEDLSSADLQRLRTRARAKGLSAAADSERQAPSIERIARDGELPVSFAQTSQWYVEQMPEVGSGANIVLASRLQGELDQRAWQRSLQRILARHEGLRSEFVLREGRLRARLLPADTLLPLRYSDLRGSDDKAQLLEQAIDANERERFDLARGPLLRCHLLRLADDEYVFLMALHHIVCDGWSLGVLSEELGALYRAELTAQPDAQLAQLPLQYADYAHWQNQMLQGELAGRQQAFWADYLADVPVLLSLPWDRPRPPQQDFHAGQVGVSLDADLVRALREQCRQRGGSMFMLLIGVWGALLSRLSGQATVVVGTPVAGRVRPELEPLIGLFMNMLAIRLDFSADPGLASLLDDTRRDILRAFDNQDLPFEKVVQALCPERNLSYTPLYQSIFTLRTQSGGSLALPGLNVENLATVKSHNKADLELHCNEGDSGISGVISYASALFDAATAERYRDYFVALLRGLVADPEKPLSSIELLSSKERDWLLHGLNDTAQSFAEEPEFFIQQFQAQVAARPESVAAVHAGQQLSYAQLNRYANQLARALIRYGVRPETRVALCVQRGLPMLVGFLGILKAGGVYVPMDAAYPSERLNAVLADASPFLLLLDSAGRSVLDPEILAKQTAWTLDLTAWSFADEAEDDPNVNALRPENLAYIIYTSGSTGRPKGVMIEHRNLMHFCAQHRQRYPTLTVDSRVLQFASFSFDASILELTLPLALGAALYLPTEEQREVSEAFVDFLLDNRISHSFLVPTMVTAMLENTRFLDAVRGLEIRLLGEAPSARLMQQLARYNQVFNEYGPTECTVCTTQWQHPGGPADIAASLGRPMANTQVYVLDRWQRPVPRGVVGELYIGGRGVARGYFQREELNRAMFIDNPFTTDDSLPRRLYRTGDLGYHSAKGELVYCGRNDNQVKIRGFRIELGEIESHLLEHPRVSSCAVIVEVRAASEPRLLAYCVAEAQQALNSLELHQYLLGRLPGYMIPAAFVQLHELPVNANGKLERKSLPAPDAAAYASQVYEAPVNAIETRLAGLWQKLLGIEQVGRHDNFYALGGNSLLATQLASEAAALGIALTLPMIIRNPLLWRMADTGEDAVVADIDAALPARQEGSKPPLFFLPAGTGNIEYFYELATSIDADYPIYGLPWLPAEAEQERSLEALAARLLKMVKAVQPQGPYRFIGYCSGGVAIHALSQLLLGQNDEVSYIGLIDALWAREHPYALSEPRQLFSQIEGQTSRIDQLDGKLYDRLRELEHELPMVELMELGKTWQLIPQHVDTPSHLRILSQQVNYARLTSDYYAPPLDIELHQFNASEDQAFKRLDCASPPLLSKLQLSEQLGWERALPAARIHVKRLPGDHNSMVSDPALREILGEAITQSVRSTEAVTKERLPFDSLIPFVKAHGTSSPLVCLPGAGNSVTSLGHFVGALKQKRSVYGLQPRGIDVGYAPHSSIRSAAADGLEAIQAITESGPVHLLGHSHGGLVAMEMAHLLRLQGTEVASLTLVDSLPPALLGEARQLTTQQIMDDFADAILNGLDIVPDEPQALCIEYGDVPSVLERLLKLLKIHGRVPVNSSTELLLGSFNAYAAARRWTYEEPAYPAQLNLVLASEPARRCYGEVRPTPDLARAWTEAVAEVSLWHAPGNHYSLLASANAAYLAQWWERQVAG